MRHGPCRTWSCEVAHRPVHDSDPKGSCGSRNTSVQYSRLSSKLIGHASCQQRLRLTLKIDIPLVDLNMLRICGRSGWRWVHTTVIPNPGLTLWWMAEQPQLQTAHNNANENPRGAMEEKWANLTSCLVCAYLTVLTCRFAAPREGCFSLLSA